MIYIGRLAKKAWRNIGVIIILSACIIIFCIDKVQILQIVPKLVLRGEIYRLVTALFTHKGILHLAFNMLALISVAPYYERRYGTVPFLLLFLFFGITVNVLGFVWTNAVGGTICGASCSVYAFIGILLIGFITERDIIKAELKTYRLVIALFYAVLASLLPLSLTSLLGHSIAFGLGVIFGLVCALAKRLTANAESRGDSFALH